jgi:hypothetical protein
MALAGLQSAAGARRPWFGCRAGGRPEAARRAGLDAWGRPEEDSGVIVVASWFYLGSGYQTTGEAWLAASAAVRARENAAHRS